MPDEDEEEVTSATLVLRIDALYLLIIWFEIFSEIAGTRSFDFGLAQFSFSGTLLQ